MFGNVHGLPGLPQARIQAGRRPPPPGLPITQPPPQIRSPPAPFIPQPDPMAGQRIDMLEQRINATEQSNRALLDELVRIQQDLKMNVKRNEMGLAEEKDVRSRLDTAVRQAQSKTFEFEDRIRRLEDAIKENRNQVMQMVSHSKSIEKTVASAQQDQLDKRSHSAQRLQEFRHEVMRVTQSKEQLERLCFSLRDELRGTTTKVDNVSQELNSLEANVRMQGRLIEDSSKRVVEVPKMSTPMMPLPRVPDNNDKMSETVRLALEGKMIQMNTNIQDLTQRLNQEGKKRERTETEINMRMNELLEDYGSTKVEKDKEMRDFDDKMKELQAGFSASEKQRILMEISSVAQDLNRKMDEKEAKLRDDTVNKLTVIEQTLVEENKRRAGSEKNLQEKAEAQMREAKMMGDESTVQLKKHIDQHEDQTKQRISELNTNMNKLDERMRNHTLEHEKVLAAEITKRQSDLKVLEGKVDDNDNRARTGIAQLQAAIGNVEDKTKRPSQPTPDYNERKKSSDNNKGGGGPSLEEIKRIQAENSEGLREQMAKDMAKLDTRMGSVETKIKQQEDRLDTKLQSNKAEEQEANTIMGDKLQQKIDNVIFSQERLKKQVDSLQTKVQDTPKNLGTLREEMEEIDKKQSKKLDQERKERMDTDKELREELDRIIGKDQPNASSVPSLARLHQDVDETQTGMKKLAEAVHVVKGSLSERIKDERKLREQEDTILRRDVERLGTKYSELREKMVGDSRAP
ncbi:hypothetical protein Pmani_014910 [Petrolisthes manimaculis]|uniref:Uncharacterized protein n=1 Tax=Petrolisthes manimaculis TaxID=1843537 RepID=A0AAE1PSY7_9EUCA|nr:hypothetical protein Pmani_014910 [Petrolisthes manimaculis]